MQAMRHMLSVIMRWLITAVTVLFTMMKTICLPDERIADGIYSIINPKAELQLRMIMLNERA